LSLFQNPAGFEPGSWKNRQKPGFSTKFTETVPKTEVLEQPQLSLCKGSFRVYHTQALNFRQKYPRRRSGGARQPGEQAQVSF
jgi:hypothetical protein